MELVTLAHATLNRIGSASSPGVVRDNELSCLTEVADANPTTLRELVLKIAEENGEQRAALHHMSQEPGYHYTHQWNATVFNIQGQNVQYSTPYAICYAYPALKIGRRYFKLEEVTPTA